MSAVRLDRCRFPQRVLMTADAVGGVWQYALELARGLTRRGTSVILAVLGPPPSRAQRTAAAAIDGLHLEGRPFRLEWMQGADSDLDAATEWLHRLEADFAPDIVHLNGFAHAAESWRSPVVLVGHSCVGTWWQAVHGEDPPDHWARYAERVARGLHAADMVIAPTRAFLDALEHTYGRLRQTMVIHNARGGPFRPHALKEQIIFSCGRTWDHAKGTDVLDAVAREVPWPTFLAGDIRSPDGDAAATPDALRLLGRLEEGVLADWLGKAAIFALPARYEPFGLSVLEAAKSGCALVLGDIPTLRELWDDAAVFADPADPPAFTTAVTRLIQDQPLRREMGLRAWQRAQRYQCDTMVADYRRAYRCAATARTLAEPPAAGWVDGIQVTEPRP